jgi:hypothetical protein
MCPEDLCPSRKAAGHKGGPGGGANCLGDIKISVGAALISQLGYIGCFSMQLSKWFEIGPSGIIKKHDYNVGLLLGFFQRTGNETDGNDCRD